jgi:ribosomal protein S18 acetylase RimI-like enzyme
LIAEVPIRIRTAQDSDIAALAEFGLALARLHVEIDERRFVLPRGGIDAFVEFFRGELARPESILLIAEEEMISVGYAFVRMEPASIEALCETSAWLHDVYVDPRFRGSGVGRQLVLAAIESAKELGSSNLMLGVSPANTQARQFYERLGLRVTMIEMRLDLE